jgi:hypothetical protein
MAGSFISVNTAEGRNEIVKIPDIIMGNHNVETISDFQQKFREYFAFIDLAKSMALQNEQVQQQTMRQKGITEPIYRDLKPTPKKKYTLNNQETVWNNLRNH